MTRMTPAHAGPRGDRPGQVAGIGRGRVHLPVGGHDHVTHRLRIMPERRRRRTRGASASTSSRAARAARARAGRPSGGSPSRSASSARRRLRGLAARRRPPAGRRTAGSASRPSASSVGDRVELAAGGAHRALEVGRLGVEDAVELAAQRPRDLARLDLEERPAGPDPAQERPDRLAVLPGHDAAAAAEPPRGRQPELGEPRRRGPAPRPGATTNSRWVRPPARLSEPRARNRPRSQAARQWSAATSQSNADRAGCARRPRRRSRTASRATDASRPIGVGARARPTSATRSHGRDGSMAASSSRSAVTRSRSERRHVRRVRLDGPAGVRRRAPTSRSSARMTAVGQAGRVVMVGVRRVDDVVEDEPRRPAATAGGQRRLDRLGGASRTSPDPRVRPRTGCWRGRRRRVRARCGRPAPRRARPGRSRSSRPPGSRRCRRRSAARSPPATASRIAGISRLGRRLVYRLPGPRTMSSASAIAASASSDASTSVGREPDALDARPCA